MKRLGHFIKSNTKLLIGVLIGAVIFSGIGITIAGTVASSDITYTNNNQSNVEGALNDLYVKADNLSNYSNIDINYWDDNWNHNDYASNEVPNSVYTSNDMNYMVFMKTIYKDNSPFKHLVCAKPKSSSKIFCLANNYWKSIVGSNEQSEYNRVKDALKIDMEAALGSVITRCIASSGSVTCYIETTGSDVNLGCNVSSTGGVSCDYCEDYGSGDCPYCYIGEDGVANCEH